MHSLSELFHALVVEKCVKYHDNQLQKARRLTRKSEAADYEPEGVDVEAGRGPPNFRPFF